VSYFQDGLDVIEFAGGICFDDLNIRHASNGDDTVISVADTDSTIRLDGADAADITADDFVFA